MIFGTFQPLFRANGNKAFKNLKNSAMTAYNPAYIDSNANFKGTAPEPLEPFLGYRPIWCFPANTIREAMAHGILTAPNVADVFFLIESENAVRVNKIKHYAALSEGKDTIEALKASLDPDCSDEKSEFLLPVEELASAKAMVLTASAMDPLKGSTGALPFCVKFETGTYENMYMHPEAYKLLKRLVNPVATALSGMELGRAYAPNMDDEALREKISIETARLRLMFFMFPPLYNMISDVSRQATLKYMLPLLYNFRKLMACYNRIGEWSYDDCSEEEYERIFRDAWNDTDMDDSIKDYMLENNLRLPERNSPCPCGSGRKFKKCHGIYI